MTPARDRSAINVGVVDPKRWRAVGHMLADAFQDDPVWMWIAPDERRRRSHLGAMFAQVLRSRVLDGLAYSTDDLEGASVWAEPDRWRMTAVQNLRSVVPSVRAIGPTKVRRALQVLGKLDSIHPAEPHWYLEFLAARVDLRGRGYGSALLKPMLDRCDFEAMPAYLESSKQENLPFYGRHGFEVTQEITFGHGAPPMWAMWREPR